MGHHQLDLAGTFMDYGGASHADTMATHSLRPYLEGTAGSNAAGNGGVFNDGNETRSFIASGLDNWRMAVQRYDEHINSCNLMNSERL